MASWEIHLRMPSRVLFLTPAIRAVSSTMQLKTLRLGGSGARMAISGLEGREGSVLRRMVAVMGTAAGATMGAAMGWVAMGCLSQR